MKTNPVWRAASHLAMLAALSFALLMIAVITAKPGLSYESYSQNKDATNCRACHGDFNSGQPYTEKGGTHAVWPSDLMTVHSTNMLGGDCDTCHGSGPRFPVYTNISSGGSGLSPIGCVGCHGRSQDGFGTTGSGYGAGLRQHHQRLGAADCSSAGFCHDDADPGVKVTVGENILPPYYANPGTGHNIPTNPCNSSENIAGSSNGLDNDGDLSYEMADADCAAPQTPGETAGPLLNPIVVTSHNAATRSLGLSYGVACTTTNNSIIYGALSQLSTYTYAGQTCNVGLTGTYTWTYPVTPDALFFLIVGRNAVAEGPYGKRSTGVERPPFVTAPACPLPQNLANACP